MFALDSDDQLSDVNQKAIEPSVAVVGEPTGAFDVIDRILRRHSASAVQLAEKRILYMLAELKAGQPRPTPAPTLFLFNLLGTFRYDWRDIAARLRNADANVPMVVLAQSPTMETIGDAMRVGVDEMLYEAELSFPHLVWQRIGGLMDVAGATDSPAIADRVSTPAISSVLGIAVPDLRASSGRLDATKIAKRLGVPIARLAALVGVSRQALTQTPDSPGIQHALEPIAQTLHVLDDALHPDDQRKWLRTSRETLEHKTPLDRIMSGGADTVARMLENARQREN